ncbi:hypothetical protein M8J75_011558 [Diaphorina citri]|nr:hypothetical protein M8J75_011558 [Diaphorina citri]
MSANTVTIISIASFLSSIGLLMCFQVLLFNYFDNIQYLFNLINVDLYRLISSINSILVFAAVFILYEALSYVLLCSLVKNSFYFATAIRSNLLGGIFSIGIQISLINHYAHQVHMGRGVPISSVEQHLQFLNYPYLGIYLCFLSFFHYSEFLIIAMINPAEVKIDSFMLNHSLAYHVAVVASWIEYSLDMYFLPAYKLHPMATYLHSMGIVWCLSGEFIRKLAIFTASTNFNHIVQLRRKDDHRLVTNGIYSVFRHPSYVGWYLFSVGTQMVLVNPFCMVAYTLASWQFFNSRIYIEEESLVKFFGADYIAYQRRVKIWIPFIQGYQEPGVRLTRRES